MYHSTLKFYYIGDNEDLVSIVQSLKPKVAFEHVVYAHKELDAEVLSSSDVIILDKQATQSFTALRKQLKQHAILIVCQSPSNFATLSIEDYGAIDDIWTTPVAREFLLFRLEQLLSFIKMKKDKELHEQYLDTLIDSMPDMVWFKDNAGIHRKVNMSFCYTVGKTREDVTNKDHCYIWDVPKEEFEKGEFVCSETEDLVRKVRKTCRFNEKVKSKNGLRQFRTYKSPIFDDYGEVMGTVGIGHDITDLENIGTELEIILRSMPFAILVKNDKNVIINVNERFEDYFQVGKDEITNMDYEEWKSRALAEIRLLNMDGSFECVNTHKNKEQILECNEEPIYDIFDNNVGQICIYRDITVETTLEKQILLNSNTDFLTGLYNRRYLYEYMTHHKNAKQVSLLYVDLDDFKMINDSYGHQAGDEALLKAAQILKECFAYDFIARIGGDEFLVIILGDCNDEILKKRVIGLLHKFEETLITENDLKLLSASIGITTACHTKIDLDEQIKHADIALYEAKQLGKAQFCFYR